MEEEVIQEYRSSLEELTANSKPLINMLTMLAEDNEQYAPEIVKVIETHLQQVYLNFIFNRVSFNEFYFVLILTALFRGFPFTLYLE